MGSNSENNQVVNGNNSQIANDNSVINNTIINKVEPAQSPPPLDIEGPVPIISIDMRDRDGCYGPRSSLITVAEFAKNNDYGNVLLQDESNVRRTYYLDSGDLGNANRSWLPSIFVPGRQLQIEYYVCGNGGYMYLSRIEVARTN
jgi:hypothetical protein